MPNLSKEGKLGQSAIEKISHYVDIKNEKELSGWFDSPKNFGDKCPLTRFVLYDAKEFKEFYFNRKMQIVEIFKKILFICFSFRG